MLTQSLSATGEIRVRVARVVADSLNAVEEDITPGTTLLGDLGAESIDFLDLVFRLEHEFGIRIPRDELFPVPIVQGDSEFVQDGKVTAEGLAELRRSMPFADLTDFGKNPEVTRIDDLYTVGLVSNYVAWKLARNSEVDRAGPVSGPGSPLACSGSLPGPAPAR